MSLFQKASIRLAVANLCRLILGELGEPVASPVTDANANASPVPVDPKTKLREALSNPKYKFRKIETLAGIIGYSIDDTRDLLHDIGARPAEKTVKQRVPVPGLYGLASRVGAGKLPAAEPVAAVNATKLAKLRELLSDPQYEYRKFDTLAEKLDVDSGELEDLLREVGARPMVRHGEEDTDFYGLISRVGAGPNASDDDDDDDDDDDFEDDV